MDPNSNYLPPSSQKRVNIPLQILNQDNDLLKTQILNLYNSIFKIKITNNIENIDNIKDEIKKKMDSIDQIYNLRAGLNNGVLNNTRAIYNHNNTNDFKIQRTKLLQSSLTRLLKYLEQQENKIKNLQEQPVQGEQGHIPDVNLHTNINEVARLFEFNGGKRKKTLTTKKNIKYKSKKSKNFKSKNFKSKNFKSKNFKSKKTKKQKSKKLNK